MLLLLKKDGVIVFLLLVFDVFLMEYIEDFMDLYWFFYVNKCIEFRGLKKISDCLKELWSFGKKYYNRVVKCYLKLCFKW